MLASRAKSIFLDAFEIASRAERAAFVDRACADDPALRQRVEALLTAHERPEPLLDRAAVPAWDAAPDAPACPAADELQPGDAVGPYVLREPIGAGGMGLVYRAEQFAPVRREVALKVVRPGMDMRRVIARFEAERQALALMDHPNIARVLDAGASAQGRPYFIMELVRGVPITDYCDDQRLSIRRRLELLIIVCRAVQHAHQKGIIHRDLKPSNVLVPVVDGQPVPKVIDFGVAMAVGDTAGLGVDHAPGAGHGQVVGTPLYMSPEQAEPTGDDVDTRTDIYALGVLLFELLTGTTPFGPLGEAADVARLRRRLLHEDPTPPSRRLLELRPTLDERAARRATDPRRLVATVRGDLDAIASKTLARDRRRRYESASHLAADLERHLACEPVAAMPPSAAYRLGKLARRRRTSLVVAGVVAIALLTGLGVAGWHAVTAREARDLAARRGRELRLRDERARHTRYAASIRRAARLIANGQAGDAAGLLDTLAPNAGAPADDLRGFEWHYLHGLTHDERKSWTGHDHKDVYRIEYAPDGRTLATCGADGTARVWDATSHAPLSVLRGHEGDVNWVTYAPSGKTLATAGDDATARLWSAATGAEMARLPKDESPLVAVAFLPDGRGFITASRQGRIRRWDLGPAGPSPRVEYHFHLKLEGLALSPVGPTLAVSGEGSLLHLLDLSDGGLRPKVIPAQRADHAPGGLQPLAAVTLAVAFRRDGRLLAASGRDGVHALLFGEDSWQQVDVLRGPAAIIYALAFAPDGNTLALVDHWGVVRLWDLNRQQIRTTLHGHTQRAWGLAYAPDGRTLVTAGGEGAIKLWDPAATPGRTLLRARRPPDGVPFGPILSVAFSVGGDAVVVADESGHVVRWDLRSGQVETRAATSKGNIAAGVVAPGGRTLATRITSDDPAAPLTLVVEDLAGARSPTRRPVARAMPTAAAFDGDGDRMVVTDPSGALVIHRVDGAHTPVRIEAGAGFGSSNAVFFARGNRLAAFCGEDRLGDASFRFGVWDTATGRPVRILPLPWTFRELAMTPDGSTLSVIRGGNDVQLVDPVTGHERAVLLGHDDAVTTATFAPDGRTLATASRDGTVRLWSVEGAEELLSLEGHAGPVTALAFDPTGDTLVSVADLPEGQVEAVVWHWRGSGRKKFSIP